MTDRKLRIDRTELIRLARARLAEADSAYAAARAAYPRLVSRWLRDKAARVRLAGNDPVAVHAALRGRGADDRYEPNLPNDHTVTSWRARLKWLEACDDPHLRLSEREFAVFLAKEPV